MKKNILALAFVGSLAMVMVGCGGDDKKKEVKIEDVVLEYKSEGAYDLSKYIAPAQNQINNYMKKIYTNDKGEKKYSAEPEETDISYSYEVNGTTVTETETPGNDITTYSFLSDRINNDNIEIVRYANIGDNVAKIITTLSKDNIDFNSTQLCKINKHHASKKVRSTTYEDVLEVTCHGDTKSNSDFFGFVSSDYSVDYFAYEKGLIESNEETCSTTTVKNNITKECEKETMEITTIN